MSLLKRPPIRLKKLRDAARGEECTINTPWCNYDVATTVPAHYGQAGEKGTALKPDDTSIAFACSACHGILDRRDSRWVQIEDDVEWYWFRGMRRTWRRFIEEGVLK